MRQMWGAILSVRICPFGVRDFRIPSQNKHQAQSLVRWYWPSSRNPPNRIRELNRGERVDMKCGFPVLALLFGSLAQANDSIDVDSVVLCWDVKEKKAYGGPVWELDNMCDVKGRGLHRDSEEECKWIEKPSRCATNSIRPLVNEFDEFKDYRELWVETRENLRRRKFGI